MKTILLIIIGLCVFILSTISISESFAIPVMSNLPSDIGIVFSHFSDTGITTTNNNIKEISFNWDGSKKGSTGKIVFDDILNERVTIHIPKDRPRLTNLDFETSLYAIQTDGTWSHIKETESQCHYILEIQVINSDFIEIETVSVSTGRWESVSTLDQSCDEYSLKQQLENNMTPQEIECSNNKHILTERPNGKLACVSPETAKHLKWGVYTNVVLNKVSSNVDISNYYNEKSLETQFCTSDMIEFLDKNSNIFDNNEPYSSPLDGDVLQGLDINPDDMVQCENELYENRNNESSWNGK